MNESTYKHYQEQRAKFPDVILLYRAGSEYQCYEQDVAEIQKVCDVATGITFKPNGEKMPFACFYYKALDTILPKLVRSDHRVAIF